MKMCLFGFCLIILIFDLLEKLNKWNFCMKDWIKHHRSIRLVFIDVIHKNFHHLNHVDRIHLIDINYQSKFLLIIHWISSSFLNTWSTFLFLEQKNRNFFIPHWNYRAPLCKYIYSNSIDFPPIFSFNTHYYVIQLIYIWQNFFKYLSFRISHTWTNNEYNIIFLLEKKQTLKWIFSWVCFLPIFSR